jgi:antitoxin (DNA-binding transcriptional repressor) of toxin-antitoxin stability system
MTICGHNVTVKQVRIAELKARLSEHLRLVRQGETIAVLDRDTPVAHIVPIRERRSVRVRKPLPGAPPLHRIALPRPANLNMDVVDLLLEERQNHR